MNLIDGELLEEQLKDRVHAFRGMTEFERGGRDGIYAAMAVLRALMNQTPQPEGWRCVGYDKPTPGTDVLLWHCHGGMQVGHMEDGHWELSDETADFEEFPLWQYGPEPPERKKVEEAEDAVETDEKYPPEYALLPCPFCGEEVAEIFPKTHFYPDEDVVDQWVVCCSATKGGCGACGGYRGTEAEAADAWNRRREKKASDHGK